MEIKNKRCVISYIEKRHDFIVNKYYIKYIIKVYLS
jgi:hypothetical protein